MKCPDDERMSHYSNCRTSCFLLFFWWYPTGTCQIPIKNINDFSVAALYPMCKALALFPLYFQVAPHPEFVMFDFLQTYLRLTFVLWDLTKSERPNITCIEPFKFGKIQFWWLVSSKKKPRKNTVALSRERSHYGGLPNFWASSTYWSWDFKSGRPP